MNQPHIMKPVVCAMLSLFMHGVLGAWIVHAIQPTHQNWQPIQPIQVSLVSEILDPASGNETGQIDQISEVAPGPASTSSDFESTPIQEAEIEQETDSIEPGAESEDIQEVRRPKESDAYEPDLPELETSLSESNSEYTQIQDDAVKRMAVTPVAKSIDPVEIEPQIQSSRYRDNDEFDMNFWQSTATMIDESVRENLDTSNPVQQDVQQEIIDLDNSRAVWTEHETREANPVESLQVVELTAEFNAEQVQAESVEITDLDAERAVWNELESELASHSESLQFTVLTVNSTAEDVTIDTENWLDDADQFAGMNFEPEDYRDLTQPVSIQEPEIEMAASIVLVSKQLEESKQSAETQIEVDFENNATLSDFKLEVAHLNIPDTEQIEFIAFNSPNSVLEVPEPEQSDQLDLNENVGIEGQPENDRIASLEQKQQPELIKIENSQESKASTAEQFVAQPTVVKKVVQSAAQTNPTLENEIAPPANDGTRKEESPKQLAALDHSKQPNGEPKNRDQLNDHLQAANLGAASLPMSSQPSFGVEGLANPAPRYPYLSRSREEEGKVILRVHVDKQGRASRIETIQSSGHSRLDKAARKAVKDWTFMPALEDGNPAAGVVHVPILFVLKN